VTAKFLLKEKKISYGNVTSVQSQQTHSSIYNLPALMQAQLIERSKIWIKMHISNISYENI